MLDLQKFLAFAQSKSGTYNWESAYNCPIAQFLNSQNPDYPRDQAWVQPDGYSLSAFGRMTYFTNGEDKLVRARGVLDWTWEQLATRIEEKINERSGSIGTGANEVSHSPH